MFITDGQPLTYKYAEAVARICLDAAGNRGYVERETGEKTRLWFPQVGRPVDGRKRPTYQPHIEASPTDWTVYSETSCLKVFMVDAEHVHCAMYGVPWADDWLFDLMAHIRDLPFGIVVAKTILDHADWLDANPEYRGQTRQKGDGNQHVSSSEWREHATPRPQRVQHSRPEPEPGPAPDWLSHPDKSAYLAARGLRPDGSRGAAGPSPGNDAAETAGV